MARVLTDSSNYENIANSIRAKNGETTEYYPSEMSAAIDAIVIPDTLVTASGDIAAIRSTDTEYTALTATADDIRVGTTAITEEGVIEGTKEIPAYHTTESTKIITAGESFSIQLEKLDLYDYTKFQAIICTYNSSMSNSVAAEKVVINDNVYAVNSTDSLSTLTKDHDNKTIEFGITNNSDKLVIVRFFTYKEIE